MLTNKRALKENINYLVSNYVITIEAKQNT